MAHGLTLINQKGGVGKSTLTCHLAGALNQFGKDVLVIDMDPQGNLTQNLGLGHYYSDMERELVLNDVLKYKDDNSRLDELVADAEQAAHTFAERQANDPDTEGDTVDEWLPEFVTEFDFVPAHSTMRQPGSGADSQMESEGERDFENLNATLRNSPQTERRLESAVGHVDDEYDYIFVDPEPDTSPLADNAIVATKNVVLPAEPTEIGTQGFSGMRDQVAALTGGFGGESISIAYRGVLANKMDNTNEADELATMMEDSFNFPVWRIRDRSNLHLTAAHGGSIFTQETRKPEHMMIPLADFAATQIAHFEGEPPAQSLTEFFDQQGIDTHSEWLQANLNADAIDKNGVVGVESLHHYQEDALELLSPYFDGDESEVVA